MGRGEDFDEKVLTRLKKEASLQALLPPQNLGRFTYAFKGISTFFKYSPWRVFVPVSLILSIIALFLLGEAIIKMASILQRGF